MGPTAMSLIKIPNKPFSSGGLGWALLPWPAVAVGLFVFHSALLAFAFYASVCLLGAWRLGGFTSSLRPSLSPRVHLTVALLSNLVLVGGYALLGKWVLPADFLLERLAGVGITTASFVWLFPYFLIGNPLAEEYFWRGALRRGGPFYTAILFGAWHSLPLFLIMPLWSAPLAVLGIMLIGFALAEVVKATKTLGDAILLHALAADLPLLIVLWLASQR